MRQSPLMDFKTEEYAARIGKLCGLMRAQCMDAVLITSQQNTRYFSGLRSIVWESKISNPGMVIISAGGDVAIVAYKSSINAIEFSTFLEPEQIVLYSNGRAEGEPPMPETFAQAIEHTLKRMGAAEGTIGMEMGEAMRIHMNFLVMQDMFSRLSKAKFVDASGAIWPCRMVKSPAEVDYLRKASAINEACFEKAFSSIEFGKTTERELMNLMIAEAHLRGAECVPTYGLLYGDKRFEGNCPPGDIVMQAKPHQVLFIDGGPSYKGYCVDIIRQAVTVGLTEKQQALYDIAKESTELALAQIKAGKPIAAVSTEVNRLVDERGFTKEYHTRGWIGHGIGLEFHELPQVEDISPRKLEAGMTLAIEPSFRDDNNWILIEQNVVVTEDGYELLSTMPDAMRILNY